MKLLYVVLWTSAFISSILSEGITYPTDGTTWKVGQSVHVSLTPGEQGETVDIFFNNDRSASLGGGPIAQGGTFAFSVPSSVPSGSTELIVVHRINFYLQSVDTIGINIVK